MPRQLGRRTRAQSDLDIARGKMRLLLAAAAVFVLVAGLTVLTYGVFNRFDTRVLTMLFGSFFLSGVLLFAASAFINTETVKTFLNATGILKGAGR